MRIVQQYSHLNGFEFLKVHKPRLWSEIKNVITSLDTASCKTKVSKEVRTKDKVFYSPIAMNKAMQASFKHHGWAEERTAYWVTSDAKLIRKTMNMPAQQQKSEIESGGFYTVFLYYKTDFF
jgi:hypothetical protein